MEQRRADMQTRDGALAEARAVADHSSLTTHLPASPARSAVTVEVGKALLLAAVTSAVYLPVLDAGFVWNDTDLTEGVMLRENGLYRVWFTTEPTNYWPLTWTSYWLEHRLWGLDPRGYHVVNVLVHIAGSLVVWRVLLRLGVPAAWTAALLFAVHPVNVESVAWITQRKNVLSLLFAATSLWLFLRATDRGRVGEYWLAVACFLLSMLSKGAAVGLPVVMLLCLWWRAGRVTAADVRRVAPFFAVALVMGCVEVWFQYVRSIGSDVVRDDSFAARLAGAGWVVWFYLIKAAWPVSLTFVYPRWSIDPTDWLAHVPNAALVAVAAWAWHARRTWGRAVLFALGTYVVLLGPVLGFFNIYFMKYSFVADHYQYLALVAPVTLATAAAWRASAAAGRAGRAAAAALGVIAAGLLGGLSWQHAHIYRDDETLWRDTLHKNPASTLARYNLAVLLMKRGAMAEAEEHLQHALALDPGDGRALANLGTIRQARGDFDGAIDCYRRALQLDPRIPSAHSNWADILQQRGDLVAAVALYRRALDVDPGYAAAHNNLGTALQRLGRLREAAEHYRLALRYEPDNAQARRNLEQLLPLMEGSATGGEW